MRYHNRNTTEEEKEEFAIAGAFEESKNLKELGNLLRDGKMKEFYQIANKVLRIKRNHPVVTAGNVRTKTASQKSSKNEDSLNKLLLSTSPGSTRDLITCQSNR
jgi:hypothetical protein